MAVKNRFADLQSEITGWRRDIHAHPEILFETHRTSALVADRLRDFGCDEVTEGIGRTGVVGVIRGRSDSSGKVIGLRADMDALPINEATGLDYASTVAGAMHACGHDGHTAMLLGAARYLTETRNFDGTVVVIFQPSEEGGDGAKAMCDDGMMDRWGIQEIYGMHNMPGLPSGQFAIRPGPLLAAVDEFSAVLEGVGSHAAKPDKSVDPTVMGAQVVTALQSLVSRNADPVQSAVVSVTAFDTSSHAYNVIPQRVELTGTVRTLSPEARDMIERRLIALIENTARAMGGSARVTYKHLTPVTVNADEPAAFAAGIARVVSGDCAEAPLVMGGEDFSFMLQQRPGAFIFVGNGDSAALHHPDYDFNDDTIPAGCSWFAELVERRLPAA